MSALRFEWDRRKAEINERKHGVSFEDAQTAFLDQNALVVADPDNSDAKERFILLGATASAKLIVVCHCYRRGDEIIRLTSARRATPRERRTYRERSSQ